MSFVWDTGSQLRATHTVDASALPADETWKFRVRDVTPGLAGLIAEPGRIKSWRLDC
ncbi:hypothetical protein [Streptomyces sp. NPDC048425]|uniref:hypothetical protein n=1 Tax=Streptomyces sp. NPDC048425 TaxID=3365548 RepID=UPI00371652D9